MRRRRRRRRRIEYPDELYHFGVKGMKWGIRKDRQSTGSKYNRGRDIAKRMLSVDYGQAFGEAKNVVKNYIKLRKDYKRRLEANMERDDIYDQEFERLVMSDKKASRKKAKWVKASNRLDELRKVYNDDSPPEIEEKFNAAWNNYYSSLDDYIEASSKCSETAMKNANSIIKQKYGYTEKDFKEPAYAKRAARDMASIKFQRATLVFTG